MGKPTPETIAFVNELYKQIVAFSKQNGHPELGEYEQIEGILLMCFQKDHKFVAHHIGRGCKGCMIRLLTRIMPELEAILIAPEVGYGA